MWRFKQEIPNFEVRPTFKRFFLREGSRQMFEYIFCFIFFLVTYIQLCIRVEFYYVKLQVLFCSIQVLLTVKFYQPCVMHPQLEKVRKSHNSSVKFLFSSLLKMRFSQPSLF